MTPCADGVLRRPGRRRTPGNECLIGAIYLTMVRDMIDPEDVARIRHFNRTITRRIGALEESFLGEGLSLGRARVLYEIANGLTQVRALRARLGLDAGHMSRLLRSLEKARLVRTSPDPDDARVRVCTLTPAGRAKLASLEGKARDGAHEWLAPLSDGRRRALRTAMDEVVRLLTASEVELWLEPPTSPLARKCLEHFVRELDERFEGGFDLARATSASVEETTPPRGAFFVAVLDGEPVGCIALKIDAGGRRGEVKRMWVSPSVRRLGVGRRLLERLEDHARDRGVRRLRLETNRALSEAQALYRACGYVEIPIYDDEPYADFAFEKRLGGKR